MRKEYSEGLNMLIYLLYNNKIDILTLVNICGYFFSLDLDKNNRVVLVHLILLLVRKSGSDCKLSKWFFQISTH